MAQAGNGRDAVDLALQEAADVVVMDVSMPELDGVAATRRIREAGSSATIIGLSVHEKATMARAMMNAGADEYINKSEAAQKLIDAIHRHRPNEK